jgi:hypothetical protein
MVNLRNDNRRAVAAVAIATMVAAQIADAAGMRAAPPDSPNPSAVDGGWPRSYVTSRGAELVVYQPQVASWNGRERMVAYAAVSYRPEGAAPALGTVSLEAATNVWLDDRLVRFSPIHITQANFGSLLRDQVRDIVDEIEGGMPDHDRIIALDRVLASVDRSLIIPKNVDGVNADPPAIFYSTTPAVLVSFDGDPIWSPIKDNDLKFAVNTNWDVFRHEPSNSFYLRDGQRWLKAAAIKGPWTAIEVLPTSFSKLPNDDNWTDVKASLPSKGKVVATAAPTVFVSTAPAELILVKGAPAFVAVPGTRLWWASNTESDVFRLGTNGPMFYLVSGRWFSAPAVTGPWKFATPTLPEDFKKISLEHPRSRVLASVPGTSQAAEAVLLAQVPQTARVNRKTIKAPDVAYQGEPQFQPIERTSVARAVNTDKDIIKVGDLYYMCFQGVWFMGRSPSGPWEVTGSVPGQIYEIPASSPAHHVTYVTVEDDTDDWVTFAAVAGYTGMMVAWGCAVWGTGWYYPPYVWYGGFAPVYYPFYPSYGYGAWYNPWTGAYGRGAAWYGPYGGAGVAARYNPVTGTYARGAAAYGPYGARGVAEAYNPRTGTYGRTQQGAGVYGSWGATSVQRGNQWAQTARVTNRATGTTTRATTGSGGGAAVTRRGPEGTSGIARTGSGDVYAGRDGNVYRRQDGSWQKYDNGSWGSVDRPTPRTQSAGAGAANGSGARAGRTPSGSDTVTQLDRDRASRAEGARRTRDYGAARASGSGGSYRPSGRSGGAARSGGGRRR